MGFNSGFKGLNLTVRVQLSTASQNVTPSYFPPVSRPQQQKLWHGYEGLLAEPGTQNCWYDSRSHIQWICLSSCLLFLHHVGRKSFQTWQKNEVFIIPTRTQPTKTATENSTIPVGCHWTALIHDSPWRTAWNHNFIKNFLKKRVWQNELQYL